MKKLKLNLRDKTAVYLDWANVYGWRKALKREPDPQKIFKYLSKFKQIKFRGFYYGTDKHPKSKKFIQSIRKVGYKVRTKPVKKIIIGQFGDEKIYKRKCDLDIEICMDVYECLDKGFNGFVFFTGDGDFEPIYKYLIKKRKQVIVVYTKGHLGREIWEMKQGIFKVELPRLGELEKPIKNVPRKAGARLTI